MVPDCDLLLLSLLLRTSNWLLILFALIKGSDAFLLSLAMPNESVSLKAASASSCSLLRMSLQAFAKFSVFVNSSGVSSFTTNDLKKKNLFFGGLKKSQIKFGGKFGFIFRRGKKENKARTNFSTLGHSSSVAKTVEGVLQTIDRQCDQIGRFLKGLGDMVSIKSSQNAW